ncbi:MAG: SDR family NAD(P)-dependent oxidoreductase [Anaerolineae bacterium]
MPLTDKIAVITGATGQLGPVVARVFASHGARVALTATHAEELAAMVQKLGLPNSRLFSSPRDLVDERAAVEFADAVVERFGRADILLHLVNAYQSSALYGLVTKDWDEMMNLNLRTGLNVMRAFLPFMATNNWGRIITLSSPLADKPNSQSAAFSAAKAGLEALTMAVAQEVRDKAVTANVIVVKMIDTQEARVAAGGRSPGAASPEEIANLMIYLCSEEAAAVNGARLPIYGRG